MKKIKTAYWISTGLIALMMLNSSFMCFASPFMKNSLAHLGFPGYFRIELGITKLLGAIAILLPLISARVKEWAYAGFFIMFVSGIIAHLVMGDPVGMWGAGIVALAILIVSYIMHHRLRAGVYRCARHRRPKAIPQCIAAFLLKK